MEPRGLIFDTIGSVGDSGQKGKGSKQKSTQAAHSPTGWDRKGELKATKVDRSGTRDQKETTSTMY